MSAIDLATLNPGWQRVIDVDGLGAPRYRDGVIVNRHRRAAYRGVLRTPGGRIVYWRCNDDHAFTKTAKACAVFHLAGLLDRRVAGNGGHGTGGEEINVDV